MPQKPINERELARFIIHHTREIEGANILLRMELIKLQEEYTEYNHEHIMHKVNIIGLEQTMLNGQLSILNKLTESFIPLDDDLTKYE